MTTEGEFLLYYTLNKSANSIGLNKHEKEHLIEELNKLNEDSAEACIKLILEHFKIENSLKEYQENVPYEGVKILNNSGKYDVEFDLANLPVKLQKILYNFIEIVKQR
jgi:deoxyribodipyrimidine photolyase